jgi:hypothetical protein
MALQSNGYITLNQIHQEAGGSSGSLCSMNDSDIRALIGKGSGVQSSMSEWYGASSTITASGNNLYYVLDATTNAAGISGTYNDANGIITKGTFIDYDGGENNVDSYAEMVSAGTLAATIEAQNLEGSVKAFIGFTKTNNNSTNDSIVGIGQYRNGSLISGQFTGVFPSALATNTLAYRNWTFSLQAGDILQYWICSAAYGSANYNSSDTCNFKYANIQGPA